MEIFAALWLGKDLNMIGINNAILYQSVTVDGLTHVMACRSGKHRTGRCGFDSACGVTGCRRLLLLQTYLVSTVTISLRFVLHI